MRFFLGCLGNETTGVVFAKKYRDTIGKRYFVVGATPPEKMEVSSGKR